VNYETRDRPVGSSLSLASVAMAQKTVILDAMKMNWQGHAATETGGRSGPYYVSYLITDTYGLRIAADSGAITANSETGTGHSRSICV